MPIFAMIAISLVVRILAKLIVGAVTAGLVYYFLSNIAMPVVNNLQQEILQKVGEFSTVGGSAMQVIAYLDFPHCVTILLTATTACISLKLMAVAIRAFGINTG
jgi:large-conductance mechanosensitive channel